MYSFVNEPRSKNVRIIKLMTLKEWERYPFVTQVGTTHEPDHIRDLIDRDAKDMPLRVILREHVGKRTKFHLLERMPETVDYNLIMTLTDEILATRLVFKGRS